MQINSLTAPVRAAASSSTPAAKANDHGPKDDFQRGHAPMVTGFRRSPGKMAAAGGATLLGANLLGKALGALHPALGVAVGGAVGAAAGYYLLPDKAEKNEKVLGGVLGACLGGISAFGGIDTGAAATAVVTGVGAVGGGMASFEMKTLDDAMQRAGK